MTAEGWVLIIVASGGQLCLVVGMIIQYFKTRDIGRVTEATHTLVNSNMGIQLKISATAIRRVADLTRDPKDIAAATLADIALAEHESKQAKVDRGEITPIVLPINKQTTSDGIVLPRREIDEQRGHL